MMLADLRNYLAKRKQANVLELSRQLDSEPEVVRSLLQFMVRKGRVRLCMKTPKCGSACMKCNPMLIEVYEWIE